MTARRYRGLEAAAGALAVLDAHAHGGAVPAWVGGAVLIALGGVVACIVVPLAAGSGSLLARLGSGIFMAVADFFAWIALLWIVKASMDSVVAPEWAGWIAMTFLMLFPWIIPALLLVRARAERAGRP